MPKARKEVDAEGQFYIVERDALSYFGDMYGMSSAALAAFLRNSPDTLKSIEEEDLVLIVGTEATIKVVKTVAITVNDAVIVELG